MVSLKPQPVETRRGLILMWLGTAIFLIALPLPLFGAKFNPPGGSQVLGGHRITAFDFHASSLQFAHAAPESRLWDLIFLLIAGTLLRTAVVVTDRLGINVSKVDSVHAVAKVIHGAMASIVALGWVLVLGGLILLTSTPIARPAVPATGEAGILPSFEHPTSTAVPTFETPWFTVSLGIGMAVLAVGIILSLLSLGAYAPLSIMLYIISVIVLAIVHHLFHQPTVDSVCHWLQTHLLVT
ncbi:hypothetical protein [Catenulispora rubra]|uniref:hypothetical protein n=1 Tax=Catenulispora rubra TaxID=280293 RepID=UPI00189204D3|nr:hypothetical protein [Catenulispora rubra]